MFRPVEVGGLKQSKIAKIYALVHRNLFGYMED